MVLLYVVRGVALAVAFAGIGCVLAVLRERRPTEFRSGKP
jgi:hypothetical protein